MVIEIYKNNTSNCGIKLNLSSMIDILILGSISFPFQGGV